MKQVPGTPDERKSLIDFSKLLILVKLLWFNELFIGNKVAHKLEVASVILFVYINVMAIKQHAKRFPTFK